MEMVKINNSLLGFKGFVNYDKMHTDSVCVNGKTYTNTYYEPKTISVDLLKKETPHYFHIFDYDFKIIDYKISVEDCNRFSRCLSEMTDIEFSSNVYANLILTAFYNGFLDNRIKNVFTSKKQYYYSINDKINIKGVAQNLTVDIPLHNYGFNNCIYYTIHVKELFRCNPELIPEHIVGFFKRHNIDLLSKNKLNQVSKLFKLKINEASKQ